MQENIQQRIIITKAHVKFQPDWLDFSRQGEESEKHIIEAYIYHIYIQPSSIRSESPY